MNLEAISRVGTAYITDLERCSQLSKIEFLSAAAGVK